jgi:hypothetical protein
MSKRICFRLAQKSHLAAVGCEQQAEHQPIDCLATATTCCAVACDGGSRHHVGRNFADRFHPVVRR